MSVSKEIERKPHSRLVIKVSVNGDQTASAYQETLDKYRKNAEVRGFRRGKVPATVLESKFGKFIREESKSSLLSKVLEGLWQEDAGIAPLANSEPDLDAKHDIVPGDVYSFSAEYDVMPEIALPDAAHFAVPAPQVEIGDEPVEQELKSIQQRNALAIDTHAAALEGDYVTLEVALPCHHHHDHGHEEHHHPHQTLVLKAGDAEHPSGLGSQLIGAVSGGELLLSGTQAALLCQQLGAPAEEELKIIFKKVERYDLPEIDDEFAQDVNEEYKTLADLKNAIRSQLQERAQHSVGRYRLQEFYRAWLQQSEIDLPQTLQKLAQQRAAVSLLEQQQVENQREFRQKLDQLLAQPTDELTQRVGNFRKQIQVELLRGAVAKAQGLQVSAEEVEAESDRTSNRVYHCSYQQLLGLVGPEMGESFRLKVEERLLADKIDKYLLETMGDKAGEKVSLKQLQEMARHSYAELPEDTTSSSD